MPLLKICLTLEGGRQLCVHIQGRSLRPPVLPPSPDLIDVDGKQPTWAQDLETLATVQEVASDATPALKRMLNETVARGVKEVSGQLPAGVKVSSEA